MLEQNGRRTIEKRKKRCAYPSCAKEFLSNRPWQEYCSTKCQQADYHETHQRIKVKDWEEFMAWKRTAEQ